MTHPTVAQNQAHRADLRWYKQTPEKGRTESAPSEWWISEYANPWTGQVIRKSGRMTGQDWWVFAADGTKQGRAHSLTWAKYLAENEHGIVAQASAAAEPTDPACLADAAE
jgi:hypothetical protein